jgi:phosphate-selective porin OprO and OprP
LFFSDRERIAAPSVPHSDPREELPMPGVRNLVRAWSHRAATLGLTLALVAPAVAQPRPDNVLLTPPPEIGETDERPATLPPVPSPPPVPKKPDLPPPEPPKPTTVTPAEVRALIDAALKEHDEKRRQAEEAKKREEKSTIKREDERKKQEDDEKRTKGEAKEWHEVGSILGMSATWDNGVWFQTPNKDFRYHVGATLQYDGAWYTAGDQLQFGRGGTGPFRDGVNFRRGRLRTEGTIWEVMDFTFELEFANGFRAVDQSDDATQFQAQVFNSPGPTDAWMRFKSLPLIGNLRVGSQKEPFSLEHLNSYRFLEFMERSYSFDAFIPTAFNNGRAPGVLAFNNWMGERGTWWLGAFKNNVTLIGFGAGDGEYALDGRLTFLPVWERDGECLWHVGAAASHRDPVNDQVTSRVRALVRNAPFPLLPLLANTGPVFGSSQDLFNLETAAVCGPLTFQAEYTASYLHNASTATRRDVGTFFTQGAYVEVLCFLTGERRGYDRQFAVFNRVIPRDPFFLVQSDRGYLLGKGAWEVGLRYSWVDLTNKGINGGLVQSTTLGLNWYLNPNMKIQWNYDIATRAQTGNAATGTLQALGVRMAMDF